MDDTTRRAFVRTLVQTGLAARLVPLLGAASSLFAPGTAQAGVPRGPRARRTMAAFADTVIPPGHADDGGAAAGFVDLLYDPELYRALVGLDVPIGAAVRLMVVDLDRRALRRCGQRFMHAEPQSRDAVLASAMRGRMAPVYEGLAGFVKVCYFGGQRNTIGWDWVGYPGPADAYPDGRAPGPPPAASMGGDGNPP